MKNNKFILAIATAILTTTTYAEVEITGKITYEGSAFTSGGTTIGADNKHKGGDVLKSEVGARFYLDGEVGEESTWHAEIQGIVGGDNNDSYTQNEVLREAYIDTAIKDWSVRAGKQQVVWGTADGIKLLDMINPTDYAEMAQNQMEDSRIPVWMINAEKDFENGGNLQVILSQPRENIFAGLNREIDTQSRGNGLTFTGGGFVADSTIDNGHDQGNAFLMKGVDSITGKRNGFLNGVPDLGAMASNFWGGFGQGGNLLGGGTGITVGQYASNPAVAGMPAGFNGNGTQIISGFAGNYDFNLSDAANASQWDSTKSPNSMFEYMDRTLFSTFDAFVNASSQYSYDMPDDVDTDVAFRYKNSTESGLNYSFNYSYNYDKNPVINLGWYNDSGEKLTVNTGASSIVNGDNTAVLTLTDSAGASYGGSTGNHATLRFTETMERSQNIGGSIDTVIETDSLGAVVLRGEALYQKDVYSPVFNRGKLAIGDLVGALKMTKGDRFKYVLGADITVLTNMMISAQFIQDRNLDYVDNNVDFDGSSCVGKGANCGVYTADFATMHMSNNFNKAEKNKEFYSLFFSKPFGSSGEHRWNNIFMFEENGGKWNRFDVEYSINDDMVATAEYNKYWGDENTQFGQLEKSSNIQLGFKYSF
jgi:hypothetical protein